MSDAAHFETKNSIKWLWEQLPASHRNHLKKSALFYDATFRMFGQESTHKYGDIAYWNRENVWRFSWGENAPPALIFGETILGTQLGFLLTDIVAGVEPRIYFSSWLGVKGGIVAQSFEEVLGRIESLQHEFTLGDHLGLLSHITNKCGWETHVVFFPPPSLEENLSIDRMVIMDAVDAMVMTGDAFSALEGVLEEDSPMVFKQFTDENARVRFMIEWIDSKPLVAAENLEFHPRKALPLPSPPQE